ncbi:MAG: HAD-IIB family hydrolase [Methylophilaceae bacterium]|nr:HAD-IIB family hydrolase [Methyloradius sp.]
MMMPETRLQQPKSEHPIYILMISLHGLIRGKDLELGRDADTGGQITYVVELAKHLAEHPDVEKVDLLTRLIEDDAVTADYAIPEEELGNGARIVRLPFGPKRYIRKELLWPHLNQAVDKCLHFLKQQGRLPDLIHTHYADAGYVGQQLSLLLGIPLVHTGHSLGRAKRERLIASGRKLHAIEKQFNFEQRISTEESILEHASLVVTSTRQEIEEQYGQYTNVADTRFSVISPGTNTSRFSPPGRKKIASSAQQAVDKFLAEPEKPMIFAISRPETRKNLKGLIEAYGNSPQLQVVANLLIVAGVRNDIRELEETQQSVMNDVLLDIDLYDLWGKVALPKYIPQEDVPELYRLVARRKGIFVNSAFTEPFGLTLIEAAASGLPIVAPDDGGPRDIVANCRNGVLTNTLESGEIAQALLQVLQDKKQWRLFSKNGVNGVYRHYSWPAHVKKYLKEIRRVLNKDKKRLRRQQASILNSERTSIPLAQMALISDIDNTLLGDKVSLDKVTDWIAEHQKDVAFGVATGRSIESTVNVLNKHRVKIPDVMITSVGAEIYYGKKLVPDIGWSAHIRHLWRRDSLADAFLRFPDIRLQPDNTQREFKLSYFAKPGQIPPLSEIYDYLHSLKLHANLIYSHEEFLDVLPIRASKGHAIRYLAYKWDLPLKSFLVAGDSGNDIEMLAGDTLAIVVGNHSAELDILKNQEQIYFSQAHYAAGILEGIEHYDDEFNYALNLNRL